MNFSLAAAVLLFIAFLLECIIVTIVPQIAEDMETILTVTLVTSLALFAYSIWKKFK